MKNELALYCPSFVHRMPPEKFLSGGCGPSGWKIDLVPDNLLGVDIRDACRIHDAMYGEQLVDPSDAHKSYCDRVFLNNLLRTIEANEGWRWVDKLRRRLAMRYYTTVRDYGGPSYWKGKNLTRDEIEAIKLPKG